MFRAWAVIISLAMYRNGKSETMTNNSGIFVKGLFETLDHVLNYRCSVLTISEYSNYDAALLIQKLHLKEKPVISISQDNVTTLPEFQIQTMKTVRLSGCVVFVVLTDSVFFLREFNNINLNTRLVAQQKVIFATRLPPKVVHANTKGSWTFEMMNVIMVYFDTITQRVTIFSYQPFWKGMKFSSKPLFLPVGYWTKMDGLILKSKLFDNKYKKFHGAMINVTALDFPPYWEDRQNEIRFGGSDAHFIKAIAMNLNFTIHVIPVSTWNQVLSLVAERKSFICPVMHYMYDYRRKMCDFTVVFEHSDMTFILATPSISPTWSTWCSPLSLPVWIATAGFVFLAALYLFLVNGALNISLSLLDAWCVITDQPVASDTLKNTKKKLCLLAVGLLLMCPFVLTNAYKSNLIAHLTKPPIPEKLYSVDQLIAKQIRIAISSQSRAVKKFLEESSLERDNKLANLIDIHSDITTAMASSLKNSTATMAGKRYIEYSLSCYEGKEGIYVSPIEMIVGRVAWPIPQDAPYQNQFNLVILRVLEAGLYMKWSQDQLLDSERRLRIKRRSSSYSLPSFGIPKTNPALGFDHLKGIFLLLFMGWLISLILFSLELLLGTGKDQLGRLYIFGHEKERTKFEPRMSGK